MWSSGTTRKFEMFSFCRQKIIFWITIYFKNEELRKTQKDPNVIKMEGIREQLNLMKLFLLFIRSGVLNYSTDFNEILIDRVVKGEGMNIHWYTHIVCNTCISYFHFFMLNLVDKRVDVLPDGKWLPLPLLSCIPATGGRVKFLRYPYSLSETQYKHCLSVCHTLVDPDNSCWSIAVPQ